MVTYIPEPLLSYIQFALNRLLEMIIKVILFVLLIYPYLSHGNGTSFILAHEEDNSPELQEYTHVSLYMVKKFIAPRTNTLVIMEKCKFVCANHENWHMLLLQNLLENLNYSISVQLFFGNPDERPWDYNLFVVDSWWTFETLRFRFPVTQHERQFYFFILLTWSVPLTSSLKFQMLRIFDMCLRFSVKNVIVMSQPSNAMYISFHTYQIYGPEHCQHLTIHEVNRYENGQLQNEFLFPDTTFNFHGCTLTVTGKIVEPLLAFDGDITNEKHLQEMERLAGIEGDVLKLAAETMNLKLRFRFRREYDADVMYENSSKSFEDLQENKAQIAIGALSPIHPNSHKFTYSFVYYTTPYVFVVREDLSFGATKLLLNPLNENTWWSVVFLWLMAIILIVILEHAPTPFWRNFVFGPLNKYPLRNMIVIFLGIPSPSQIVPQRNFARFLLMAWLLLTFELRNAYQGKMFDSLRQAKRLPIPRTISELIEGDYTYLAHAHNDFYPWNKTKIVNGPLRRLQLLNSREERLTTASLLDYLRDYNLKYWHNSSLTYVQENIYFFQFVMFFPKHSTVSESFNRKLKLITNAGITAHIAKRYMRWQRRSRKTGDNKQASGVAQITNQHLRGLYVIYGVLCKVAIMFFILELLAKKSRRLKTLMDWLN